MTSYVNVGAIGTDGKRFASKAALKRALVADSDSVRFDSTSPFTSPSVLATLNGPLSELGGIVLSVVGPDPYSDRRWYATVSVNSAGKVVCK